MKLRALLPTLALLALACSCSNDDDLPDVTETIGYAGATWQGGAFWLTPDDTLTITSLSVASNDPGLSATIGAVSYYWNYMLLGTAINPPFAMEIPAAGMAPGTYVLQLTATVYQTEKSVGIDYITLPVHVVATPAEIPEGASEGTFLPEQTDMRSGVSPTV